MAEMYVASVAFVSRRFAASLTHILGVPAAVPVLPVVVAVGVFAVGFGV